MSSSLNLRTESNPPIYGYRHLLMKVENIMDAITLSMLTSQRQYFTDLDVFIFCFDCLAVRNTDLLCILLLSKLFSQCELSHV